MPIEQEFPGPLVIAPTANHTRTIFLLHGRGSKADTFASEMALLQKASPHAKLIFLQARKQRATVYKKSITRQWFDDWHLNPNLQSTDVVHSRYDEGLQTSGLGATVSYLHGLIRAETALVGGAQNVAIGGFSQGAAAALVTALLWDENESLGGLVALSAWLPYTRQMADILESGSSGDGEQDVPPGAEAPDDFDPFERPPSPEELDQSVGGVQAALNWLRAEIDMPADGDLRLRRVRTARGDTSVLFCHGIDDHQVEPERSREASDFLSRLGIESVERRSYASLGHEVSDRMVGDVVEFIQSVMG